MTALRRAVAMLAMLAAASAMAACQNVTGVAETREALEQIGYRDVEVSFRSGGGIDVARVDAAADEAAATADEAAATADEAADDEAPDGGRLRLAAAAVWRTLPLRFDRLRLSVDAPQGMVVETFGYEQLTGLFGARPPWLDRRQVGDEVVKSGLWLVVLLSAGALASVGVVVGVVLFALRNVRRRRRAARGDDHGDWDGSFPGFEDASPTAGAAAEGPEAIPS